MPCVAAIIGNIFVKLNTLAQACTPNVCSALRRSNARAGWQQRGMQARVGAQAGPVEAGTGIGLALGGDIAVPADGTHWIRVAERSSEAAQRPVLRIGKRREVRP